MFPRLLLLLLVLLPLSSWAARLPGIRFYERGEYAKASRALKQDLNNPKRNDEQKALARVYLAASLMALEKEDEAYEQLEELARTYPEQRVDPALFPPRLVELELKVRERLNAERLRQEAEQAELNRIAAAEEAERRKREQEEAARNQQAQVGTVDEPQVPAPAGPVSTFRLRPEITGYGDVGAALSGGQLAMGGALGLTIGGGPLEATVRTLAGGERWAWELEAGYLFGTGAFQPRVALRGTLFPDVGKVTAENPNGGGARFGIGAAVGGRLALSRQLSLLMDVGGEVLLNAPEPYNATLIVISAGVGYNLF
ncbi:hypothetical protein BO221_43665 [Archangium sp. Cb G35]|uniref:tetratricopeptide repeat protein n=1 Tax=Archangium sp. Cb G35 TaxID=1920190 RepID=UPI0009367C6D|nr:hypothetical protein [Archangium sp. Cb G35]OJT17896.1 hypothetical protein BO221_43665 [Archangium sp. Cb G35]